MYIFKDLTMYKRMLYASTTRWQFTFYITLSILIKNTSKSNVELKLFFRLYFFSVIHQIPYLLAYSIGGMHSMLLKWVENDMTIPSFVLVEQLKILICFCN